jgi:alkanesulfonate monooxygenase SsuD/methylene tetrahydromethanopterin reductase-like flavin-dependent oxidoreductase (luciferase family)
MKLSVSVTNYSWADRLHDRLASLAGFLDDTVVDTLWVPDHLLQADPASRTDEAMLEAYTVLGYLAAATSRIRLGTMVTAATFRAPALLIKAVTTLDVLSAGRAWLGTATKPHSAASIWISSTRLAARDPSRHPGRRC